MWEIKEKKNYEKEDKVILLIACVKCAIFKKEVECLVVFMHFLSLSLHVFAFCVFLFVVKQTKNIINFNSCEFFNIHLFKLILLLKNIIKFLF